ncbi:SDR family NAD(P)-dependent oxidoreductase [Parasphingorhabdus cellanae]|uniref:SDR family NAD(P)-dependent oxidoreductase n=1 Tax=Parasphingorhabdus cellanae TaxID=2806553 RepID=A0ABX7TAK9_9SPHN|nr:SDR family NAD(P)-dependent oxidoreductase [Parasphingorhabdus cellanae]QTD57540.1 SDR family NAD(P)-dependent oxidoreductase [Parasphingorhabdus cellanae]
MEIKKDMVSFITGGAGGIGLAIASALAARGARIMLADIDQGKLDKAAAALTASGADVGTVLCDVADEAQVRDAANATINRFGKVHIVVNNAGVALGGTPGQIAMKDWRWIVDINLIGVAHGVEIFTPLIQSHGEGGYFINTASMAGHGAAPGMAPYNATKFAVVGYSEALKQELAPSNIGVSILCPAWVKTNIHRSAFDKPTGGSDESDPRYKEMAAVIDAGIDPADVAEWTAQCVEADRLYIFTHPEFSGAIDYRHAMINADYDACSEFPAFQEKDAQ